MISLVEIKCSPTNKMNFQYLQDSLKKGKLELETQTVASCSQSYVLINQYSSIKEKLCRWVDSSSVQYKIYKRTSLSNCYLQVLYLDVQESHFHILEVFFCLNIFLFTISYFLDKSSFFLAFFF